MLAALWLAVAVNVIHFTGAIGRDILVVKDQDFRQPFYLTNVDNTASGKEIFDRLIKTLQENVSIVGVYRNKESPEYRITESTPSAAIFGSAFGKFKHLLITTKTQVPVYKNEEFMGYVEFLGGITNGYEIFRLVHHHLRRKTISSIRLKSAAGWMLVGTENTFPVMVEGSLTLWASVKEGVQVSIPMVKDAREDAVIDLFQEKPDGAHILERLRETLPRNVVIVTVRKNKENGTEITNMTEPMETSGKFNFKKLKKLYVTTKSQVQVYINGGYAGVMEIPGRMEHATVGSVRHAVEKHLGIALSPARADIDMDNVKVRVRIRNDTIWKIVEVVKTPAEDHQLQSQQLGEQKQLLALKIRENNGVHIWKSVMELYGSDIAEIRDENERKILPYQDDPEYIGHAFPTPEDIGSLNTLYVVSKGTVAVKVVIGTWCDFRRIYSGEYAFENNIGNRCDQIFFGEYAFESNIWNKVIAKWKWVEELGIITTPGYGIITKDGNRLLKTTGLSLNLKQKIPYIASDTTLYYAK